jgi:hypothetical protein
LDCYRYTYWVSSKCNMEQWRLDERK